MHPRSGMLQASGQSFVCWRCAARRLGPRPSLWTATQPINSPTTRHLASVRHGSPERPSASGAHVNIRQRLRIWEKENPGPGEMMMTDFAEAGALNNNITRPQSVALMQLDVDDSSPLFDGDELVDLRSEDATLNAGDLVELSPQGSRRPGLAICLGRINGYEHFYTISGNWFSSTGVKTLFVVKNFVGPEEMGPIIAALPSGDVSLKDLNILQDLGVGPSRAAAAGVLRKMLTFVQKAEAVYQANAGTLDASSAFIGDPIKHRYLTLHEITDLLLADTNKYGTQFDSHSLYAVHRALLQDEVFFRPLRQKGHKESYLFEISPLSEVRIVQKVEKLVRAFLGTLGQPIAFSRKEDLYVAKFLWKAQKVIDDSRKTREWSEAGLIGPGKTTQREAPDWSPTDLEILQFIELWAGYQKFTECSRLQTIGAALLRHLDRYQEAPGYLPVIGWTFLQEVGWIPPWEIPARYSVRFPGVGIKRGGGYVRPLLGMHVKSDALSRIRKPLNNVTAYCIDDITAREIDDAVSLERTSNPEEYWIHVHVADPASSFAANSPVAKYAELIPEAIYLPGHLESMLPESLIQDRFSLAPDRPCLTFSALVNKDGVVLDEKIAAHSLKDVVYMTYENAALAIGEVGKHPLADGTEWALGSQKEIATANRKMTQPDGLTKEQKDDLVVLSQLGKAIQAKRLERGATQFFQPRPTASVGFKGVELKDNESFIDASGDPNIHVHYSQQSGPDLVENAMKLANEVAARWCHERGIPIPYRIQPHALRHAALIQQFTRDVLNPMVLSGGRPNQGMWRHLRSLLGSDEVSTTPGPHFTLGSEMYTKATSPLRRFNDLIVHWQIEAALLEEHRLQRKLTISTSIQKQSHDLKFLPFSREELDRMLPMLRLREKQARTLTNGDGADQWILQAMVRAWRFKEGSLPETFKLTVDYLARARILGQLDWFERRAVLRFDALNSVISSADIEPGDIIEVRITDINAYSRQIFVEAVSVVKSTKGGKTGSRA
ncbi:hypothetical protein F4808DRAFT_445812 [Astrocystis sublimbata]|nr:hypothetical protein F4808DRAFT_445812 [Astrocystis sublimbata]